MDSTIPKIAGLAILLVAIAVFSMKSISSDSNAQTSEGLSKKQVEKIVGDYIRDNPQVIVESLTKHQQQAELERNKKAQTQITAKKDELENDPQTPYAGNADGDITIVEFFDYACGYCKRAFKDLAKVMEEDSGVKVVFKEYPILGPNSVLASKAALAVYVSQPENYFAFHQGLMNGRTNSKEAILKIAADSGVDMAKMEKALDGKEVQDLLQKNSTLGNELGIRGTPAFIINGEFVPGALSYDGFKQIIAKKRSET